MEPLKSKGDSSDKTTELLQKILAVQLHTTGVTQGRIAKIVSKSKSWVNALLKGVPAPSTRLSK
jgi:hypothetical protein